MNHPEEYVKRIMKVLVYIEDHLEEEITMSDLARVACHSVFHFHRIFQTIVGETAHKYIRRLRLEKAARRLLYTKQSITEIALETNYETPSAFTRAFKQCMGKSPKNYRALCKEVSAMKKEEDELSVVKPNKIEEVSDLNLLFIRRFGNYITSSESAWKAMLEFIKINQLDKSKIRYFSIPHDDPQVTSENKLRFDACIETSQDISEKGEVGRQVIKGGKYAVFCEHVSMDRVVDSEESGLTTKVYVPLL